MDFLITRFLRITGEMREQLQKARPGGKGIWEDDRRRGRCGRHMAMNRKWFKRIPCTVTSRRSSHGTPVSAECRGWGGEGQG